MGESGAHCQLTDGENDTAVLTLKGSIMQVEVAEKMVKEVLAASQRPKWEQKSDWGQKQDWGEKKEKVQKLIAVDKPLIAGVIGKGGCNLKEMGEQSGCKIHFQA